VIEHADSFTGHFGADAVPREDEDFEFHFGWLWIRKRAPLPRNGCNPYCKPGAKMSGPAPALWG
jgi:hypothetical protein